MRPVTLLAALTLLPLAAAAADGDWHSLFDGKTLDGWRPSEHKATFSVVDGAITTRGERSHLFYAGPVADHNFRNFELELEVMTEPDANSGVYFHTAYQEEGWPAQGYEAQVNNTQSDWRRTGSLYAIDDVREQLVPDHEWFTYNIRVVGKRVVIKVNGETAVDYVEPDDAATTRPADMAGRLISQGTFALQGHDPGSVVHFRNIRVRLLD